MDLEKGFRPPFNFSGAWLYSDDKPLVHLIEINPNDKDQSDSLGSQTYASETGMEVVDHIAFSGCDYSHLIKRLKQQIKYFERTVPLTNEHQVFAEGPDGLRIELLFKTDEILIKTNN